MTDYTVCISTSEYAELVEARNTLNIAKEILFRDSSDYGTSAETKRALDLVLMIERKEKAD